MEYYSNHLAYSSSPIASSGYLGGTSNSVFSDWCLNIYVAFNVKTGKEYQRFCILGGMFNNNIIFESEDFAEIQKFINDHKSELEAQIKNKAKEWFKHHPKFQCVDVQKTEEENVYQVININSDRVMFKGLLYDCRYYIQTLYNK